MQAGRYYLLQVPILQRFFWPGTWRHVYSSCSHEDDHQSSKSRGATEGWKRLQQKCPIRKWSAAQMCQCTNCHRNSNRWGISSVLQPRAGVTRPPIAHYKNVRFAALFSINLCCLIPLNGLRSKSSDCSRPVVDGDGSSPVLEKQVHGPFPPANLALMGFYSMTSTIVDAAIHCWSLNFGVERQWIVEEVGARCWAGSVGGRAQAVVQSSSIDRLYSKQVGLELSWFSQCEFRGVTTAMSSVVCL